MFKNNNVEDGSLLRTRRTKLIVYRTLGGAVASRLVLSPLDRAVLVGTLPGNILLGSWARHFNLTTPLSTQVFA